MMDRMSKFKRAIARVRKAIVAALVPLISLWLLKAGIDVDNETIEVIVTTVLTAFMVWLVPNTAPYVEDDEDENAE